MDQKEDILPILSRTEVSNSKTIRSDGTIIYIHNIRTSYTPEEREKVLLGFDRYFVSERSNNHEQQAYIDLMWYLFPEYMKQAYQELQN